MAGCPDNRYSHTDEMCEVSLQKVVIETLTDTRLFKGGNVRLKGLKHSCVFVERIRCETKRLTVTAP